MLYMLATFIWFISYNIGFLVIGSCHQTTVKELHVTELEQIWNLYTFITTYGILTVLPWFVG